MKTHCPDVKYVIISGDMERARHIASDALELFRKVWDEKAVAIACNNVGKTLLALSIDSQAANGCIKVDGACLVKTAIQHYDEAINIGPESFMKAIQMLRKQSLRNNLRTGI